MKFINVLHVPPVYVQEEQKVATGAYSAVYLAMIFIS
jgi:hypothetical protein